MTSWMHFAHLKSQNCLRWLHFGGQGKSPQNREGQVRRRGTYDASPEVHRACLPASWSLRLTWSHFPGRAGRKGPRRQRTRTTDNPRPCACVRLCVCTRICARVSFCPTGRADIVACFIIAGTEIVQGRMKTTQERACCTACAGLFKYPLQPDRTGSLLRERNAVVLRNYKYTE